MVQKYFWKIINMGEWLTLKCVLLENINNNTAKNYAKVSWNNDGNNNEIDAHVNANGCRFDVVWKNEKRLK